MARRAPEGPPPPPAVQRLRLRYAKRGRLRFTSHRDIARAVERALRRARVPMAYSAGFSPHPRISWVGAAPTGVASEAEYVEIALAARVDPEQLRADLDASLPDGLDVLDAVEAPSGTSLPDRVQASEWRVELPDVPPVAAETAVRAFLAAPEVLVQRLGKAGLRTFDARGAVLRADVLTAPAGPPASGSPAGTAACATLVLVVRHVTPAVRPDDVLSGLRLVADLETPVAPQVTRVRQGPLTETGEVDDPLAPDRVAQDVRQDGATRQVDDPARAGVGADGPG